MVAKQLHPYIHPYHAYQNKLLKIRVIREDLRGIIPAAKGMTKNKGTKVGPAEVQNIKSIKPYQEFYPPSFQIDPDEGYKEKGAI